MSAGRFAMPLALGALLTLPLPSSAHAELTAAAAPPGAGQGLAVEEVNFPISCSPTAQKAFNHAAWTLHSFWYPEALKGFSDIAKAEPNCTMAYWGVAMSHWYPLWYPPSEAALKAGAEAVVKADAAGSTTEREKAYVAAIAAFYKDYDKVDHKTRAIAYEKAMEQVHARFPDDQEAGVFYALALNATQQPTDKSFANKKKAAEILEKGMASPAEPPRRRALLDSQRRHTAACRTRATGGDVLRQDRSGGAARATHAVAHLYPARPVAAVDRFQ
jgi:hypothetical protein